MEYVLDYIEDPSQRIILVEKNRPEWMRGRFNLPGGKVEKEESISFAAIREANEECGVTEDMIYRTTLMGTIVGKHMVKEPVGEFKIYCYKIKLNRQIDIKPRAGETEKFFWAIPSFCTSAQCLPNLKMIVPLINFDISGWEITDNNFNDGTNGYTWNIHFPSKSRRKLFMQNPASSTFAWSHTGGENL